MNERIRLLAAQAGIEFVYDPTETPLRAFVECWEDDMQKFAELIVKETLRITGATPSMTGTAKQHFGVEE